MVTSECCPEMTKAASKRFCGGFGMIKTVSRSTSRIDFFSRVWADTDQLRSLKSIDQVLKRVQVVIPVECEPFKLEHTHTEDEIAHRECLKIRI